MKEIVIPHEVIYEFFIDPEIVNSYLEKIKNSPIVYESIRGTEQIQWLKIGYPIPYNKKLFDILDKSLNQVGAAITDKPINLSICDAWITCAGFGAQSAVHNHTFSLLSGLLYLDDSKTVTEFYYKSEFLKRNENLFFTQENKKIQIKPEKGKLIIWPSYIQHKATVHKEIEQRYTLAFNSFINGVASSIKTSSLTCATHSPKYLEE